MLLRRYLYISSQQEEKLLFFFKMEPIIQASSCFHLSVLALRQHYFIIQKIRQIFVNHECLRPSMPGGKFVQSIHTSVHLGRMDIKKKHIF